MSLFQPAAGPRFIRALLYGRPAAGKTFLGVSLAGGLAQVEAWRGNENPVHIFATEDGPRFQAQCLQRRPMILDAVQLSESMSTPDRPVGAWDLMLQAMPEFARSGAPVVFIDNITHVWSDHKRALGPKPDSRDGKSPRGWADSKEALKKFYDDLAALPCHVIAIARAVNDYANDTGRMERVGDKPLIEDALLYNFHLVLRMERVPAERGGFGHLAHVERDTSHRMAGEVVQMPGFKSFRPIWDCMDWPSRPGELEGVPLDSSKNFAIGMERIPQQPQDSRGQIHPREPGEAPEKRPFSARSGAASGGETAPEAPGEASERFHAPDQVFAGVTLRSRWAWPGTSAAYLGPWENMDDEQVRALKHYSRMDADKQSKANLMEAARLAFMAGWTPAEFQVMARPDLFVSATQGNREALIRWLNECHKARSAFWQEEGG